MREKTGLPMRYSCPSHSSGFFVFFFAPGTHQSVRGMNRRFDPPLCSRMPEKYAQYSLSYQCEMLRILVDPCCAGRFLIALRVEGGVVVVAAAVGKGLPDAVMLQRVRTLDTRLFSGSDRRGNWGHSCRSGPDERGGSKKQKGNGRQWAGLSNRRPPGTRLSSGILFSEIC